MVWNSVNAMYLTLFSIFIVLFNICAYPQYLLLPVIIGGRNT